VVDSKLRIYYAGTHHRSAPVQTSLLSRKRKELSSAIYSAGIAPLLEDDVLSRDQGFCKYFNDMFKF
jgi:hypothetical protein